MDDALRQAQGGAATTQLVAASGVAPDTARAMIAGASAELGWLLEQTTLSRGGLADLIEVLGSADYAKHLAAGGDLFRDEAITADGIAVLDRLLGSKDKSRALAARIALQSGAKARTVADVLPGLAVLTLAGMAGRAQRGMSDILGRLPPLGRLSCGNPHGDLAGILRRRCGAGPYSPGELWHVVRGVLARAGRFHNGGVLGWYLRFMLARVPLQLVRMLARVAQPRR